jgi:hypothetical protein
MARKKKLNHEFDKGIRREVEILQAAGKEAFESCEGGKGHTFPECDSAIPRWAIYGSGGTVK